MSERKIELHEFAAPKSICHINSAIQNMVILKRRNTALIAFITSQNAPPITRREIHQNPRFFRRL